MNIAFFLMPKSRVSFIYNDSTFRQGLEKLRNHGYTAVPVLTRDGAYAGTLSEGDFLWSIVEMGGATLADCEDMTVNEILKPDRNPPVSITADIRTLTERLLDQNFVPVTDDRGKFMGIVTRHTVLEFLRDERPIPLNIS